MELSKHLKSETAAIHLEIDSQPFVQSLLHGKLDKNLEYVFIAKQAKWLKLRVDSLVLVAEKFDPAFKEAKIFLANLNRVQNALAVLDSLRQIDQMFAEISLPSSICKDVSKHQFLGMVYVVCGSLNGFLMIGNKLKRTGNQDVTVLMESLNQVELREIWEVVRSTLDACKIDSPDEVSAAAICEFKSYQVWFRDLRFTH